MTAFTIPPAHPKVEQVWLGIQVWEEAMSRQTDNGLGEDTLVVSSCTDQLVCQHSFHADSFSVQCNTHVTYNIILWIKVQTCLSDITSIAGVSESINPIRRSAVRGHMMNGGHLKRLTNLTCAEKSMSFGSCTRFPSSLFRKSNKLPVDTNMWTHEQTHGHHMNKLMTTLINIWTQIWKIYKHMTY